MTAILADEIKIGDLCRCDIFEFRTAITEEWSDDKSSHR